MAKLSELIAGQIFKLATSDNICVFLKKGIQINEEQQRYFYKCLNSGIEIETLNDYEVFEDVVDFEMLLKILEEKEMQIKELLTWKAKAEWSFEVSKAYTKLVQEKFNYIDLKKYEYSIEDLQKVSAARERIKQIIYDTNLHEDLFENLLYPFERLLKHNGINLTESDV